MGDLTDIFTPQKHQNLFYKITNGGLVLYIKGNENACVGLARQPMHSNGIYWVLIGCQCRIYIMHKGLRYEAIAVRNILSNLEYRKFWISWNNGKIKLGIGDEVIPIISMKIYVQDLHYVTFSVLDQKNVLHWKCYLPPQTITASIRPALAKVEGGEPHWVEMNEKLPEDLIIGGYEKETLYIMRAFHETALTPGKFVSSIRKGYIPWGGRMHEKVKLELLCGYDCVWIPVTNNKIPLEAIEAGYTETGHEIMYIGRAMCDGNLIPGKIAPSHNVCYIPYDGIEIASTEYEILINPSIKKKCANSFFISDLGIL